MTTRELIKRAADAEAALKMNHPLVVYQGCDESQDEAIARAGAEHWAGTIVISRLYNMTAAQFESARRASRSSWPRIYPP